MLLSPGKALRHRQRDIFLTRRSPPCFRTFVAVAPVIAPADSDLQGLRLGRQQNAQPDGTGEKPLLCRRRGLRCNVVIQSSFAGSGQFLIGIDVAPLFRSGIERRKKAGQVPP